MVIIEGSSVIVVFLVIMVLVFMVVVAMMILVQTFLQICQQAGSTVCFVQTACPKLSTSLVQL